MEIMKKFVNSKGENFLPNFCLTNFSVRPGESFKSNK